MDEALTISLLIFLLLDFHLFDIQLCSALDDSRHAISSKITPLSTRIAKSRLCEQTRQMQTGGIRGGGSSQASPGDFLEEVSEQRHAPYPSDESNARPLRIFCATWNVNGKPPLVPLEDWLVAPADGERADVYLIGFQEVQDLKLQGALLTDEDKGRQWARAALRTLGALPAAPGAPYRCVAARQLVGMSLLVLARAGLDVAGVAVAEAGTGFMSQGGNKGGVAARFVAGGLSYCVVCSHLAASTDNVERRNQVPPPQRPPQRPPAPFAPLRRDLAPPPPPTAPPTPHVTHSPPRPPPSPL